MGKEAKTNAMRILERAKVAYTAHEYPHEEGVAEFLVSGILGGIVARAVHKFLK